MYSKQEAALLTQEFWTLFGRYIAPLPSADGEKINWVNYKTGLKDTRFVMVADTGFAKVGIVLQQPGIAFQQLYFEKFAALKKQMHKTLGEAWQWQPGITNQHGKLTSEIFTTLENVNVLNRQDWPAIISFLKPRMIALDQFWCEYKYAFEG